MKQRRDELRGESLAKRCYCYALAFSFFIDSQDADSVPVLGAVRTQVTYEFLSTVNLLIVKIQIK